MSTKCGKQCKNCQPRCVCYRKMGHAENCKFLCGEAVGRVDRYSRLERAVIDAAVAWKKGFGFEGNHAQFVALSQAVDNLISGPMETIQECVERTWIECPVCEGRRAVDAHAQVAACGNCGDSRWWNLGVTPLAPKENHDRG